MPEDFIVCPVCDTFIGKNDLATCPCCGHNLKSGYVEDEGK